MVGIAVFSIQFPSFLFSLIGGSVADRYNKYHVLLITQIASMVQAILMTLTVFFLHYTVTEILVLSALLGLINAFDVPARQSLVQFMVDNKEDLGNAIALNSSMVNLARLTGPAIAGVVLDTLGAGPCFLINAISFLAVISSLLMMRLPANMTVSNSKRVMQGLKEGISYVKTTHPIGIILIMMASISFLVLPYVTLFPVIAKTTLNGSASTYGYLNSFTGIGALGGAIFLASLKSHINLRRVLILVTIALGTGLILFSHTSSLVLALLFATIAGFSRMSQITLTNTLLQTNSSTEMRGRVMSYFTMAAFGMNPLGSLLVGSISQYVGTPITILSEGAAAILIAILFFPYLWKVVLIKEKIN